MKRFNLLFFCLVFFLNNSFAQDNNSKLTQLIFEGVVFNSDSLQQPLQGVNLIVNNNKGATTNAKGVFSIPVSANDSIKFTHVGFRSFMIYIPDSVKSGKFTATLFMVHDTIKLEQFFVWSDGSYDSFKNSILNMDVKPDLSLIRAKNNVFLSVYEAKTTTGVWTAEDNQKNAIKKEENKVIYKGQVQPENTLNFVSISFGIANMPNQKTSENDFYFNLLNLQNQNNLIYSK